MPLLLFLDQDHASTGCCPCPSCVNHFHLCPLVGAQSAHQTMDNLCTCIGRLVVSCWFERLSVASLNHCTSWFLFGSCLSLFPSPFSMFSFSADLLSSTNSHNIPRQCHSTGPSTQSCSGLVSIQPKYGHLAHLCYNQLSLGAQLWSQCVRPTAPLEEIADGRLGLTPPQRYSTAPCSPAGTHI